MNQKLGEIIARLRKEKGMTQEDLARELNISYQAVSKWENGISSPDFSNIKALAQLFGVSIDALFGLELLPEKNEIGIPFVDDDLEKFDFGMEMPDEKSVPEEKSETNSYEGEQRQETQDRFLPWADDGTLRVVMYRGRKLLEFEEVKNGLLAKRVQLEFHGEALNVSSCCDVSCGTVSGSVSAEGDVNCDDIGASVSAGGDVNCDDVGGDIRCGGDVDCGAVVGSVSAGGDVDCGSVGGNVTSAGDVDCGGVAGNVYKG